MACTEALRARDLATSRLKDDPYSLNWYHSRMRAYEDLGYADLAAADAYKLVLLVDEVSDESGEYHDEAIESLCRHIECQSYEDRLEHSSRDEVLKTKLMDVELRPLMAEEREAQAWCASVYGSTAPASLSKYLLSIGCIRPAWTYAQQALKAAKDMPDHHAHALALSQQVLDKTKSELGVEALLPEELDVQSLPHRGSVRREVYPWNEHEADRMSEAAVTFLNEQLNSQVAPKLEVAVTELPALTAGEEAAKTKTVKQLGVFAKEDIHIGEEILKERSLLTANNKLHEPMCDACSAILPDLSQPQTQGTTQEEPVACPECIDTVFCSQECLDLAQESYHAAICGADIDSIARDVPAKESADTLYTLLLLRALAMAQTQDIHPLDLKEVKYIWGDFTTSPPDGAHEDAPRTLPFTFEANILSPLHLLESLDVNIFTAPDLAETWVYNTLYAKFRGTASARMNPRDGRPEVAAVHPLWCLANHSCDPNVKWDWAGEIRFFARDKRITWRSSGKHDGKDEYKHERLVPFIAKGEEILSHYVDIDLPVGERREWGMGALGGPCMCARCQAEAS